MAVQPVAARAPRHAAEQELHDLEVPVVLVGPGEDEMRAGAVARRHGQMRGALAQRAGLAVEEARVRVQAVGQGRGEARVEQAALRQHHLEQVVEPLIE